MSANRLVGIAGAGLLLSVLSGCAAAWTDKSGARHLLGFVSASTRPSDDGNLAGDIVEVSTIGISFLSNASITSLTIGYDRATMAAFRDDAVARGPFDRITARDVQATRTQKGE